MNSDEKEHLIRHQHPVVFYDMESVATFFYVGQVVEQSDFRYLPGHGGLYLGGNGVWPEQV